MEHNILEINNLKLFYTIWYSMCFKLW